MLRPATPDLGWHLADIGGRYGSALVLMPQSRWVSPDLALAHSPGAQVELAFLEDRLLLERGALRLAGPPQRLPEPATPPAFALAFDGAWRAIDEAQYQQELGKRTWHAVFFDIVLTRERACRAGRRGATGAYDEVWMPPALARLLCYAVVKGRPVRPSEVCQGRAHPDKMLSRALTLFDVSVSRFQRLYFHRLAGEAKAEREFVFRPPPGATFLALCPVGFAEQGPRAPPGR
jgi:hypothetical protein